MSKFIFVAEAFGTCIFKAKNFNDAMLQYVNYTYDGEPDPSLVDKVNSEDSNETIIAFYNSLQGYNDEKILYFDKCSEIAYINQKYLKCL